MSDDNVSSKPFIEVTTNQYTVLDENSILKEFQNGHSVSERILSLPRNLLIR